MADETESGEEPSVAAPVDVTDREALQSWLEKQGREAAIVFAARVALRVLPLIGHVSVKGSSRFGDAIALPVFRAMALPWAAATYPAHGRELSAARATDVARAAARATDVARAAARAADVARAAAFAAFAAADAARADDAAAADDARAAAAFADAAAAAAAARAAADDAAAARAVDIDYLRQGLSPSVLAERPLWLDGVPGWAADGWAALEQRLLSAEDEHWEAWTDWYEARLDGAGESFPWAPAVEELDVGRVLLPDELWEEGPKAVNGEIRRQIEDWRSSQGGWDTSESLSASDVAVHSQFKEQRRLPGSEETTEPILPMDEVVLGAPSEPPPEVPAQGHGPHFTLADGKLAFAPVGTLDENGNDFSRLSRFHPLVVEAASELVDALEQEIGDARNAYVDERLLRWARTYRTLVDRDFRLIDYELLVGYGEFLANRLAGVGEDDLGDDRPPLTGRQANALKDLVGQHGFFVTGSKAGLALIADAERHDRTPREEEEFRKSAQILGEKLEQADIADAGVVETVKDAAEQSGTGRQKERTAVFGLGTLKNATIVLSIGGVTYVAMATLAAVNPVGIGPASALALLVIESLKASKPFNELKKSLVGKIDQLSELDMETLKSLPMDQFRKIACFVLENEIHLRRMAGRRPEFDWLHHNLDWLEENFHDDCEGRR